MADIERPAADLFGVRRAFCEHHLAACADQIHYVCSQVRGFD
jgi:hypothetical protein